MPGHGSGRAGLEALPQRRGGIGLATFSSLRYRNFRFLWLGHLCHATGMWMDAMARNWLIWTISRSGVALGLVNVFRNAPFLVFALVGGVAADRYDKRRLLMTAQSVDFLAAVTLATLVVSGHIQIWHIYLTALVAGTAMSFNQPTRQSLVPALVERGNLMNAIALMNMAGTTNRVVGPAIAGVLVGIIGIGNVYVVVSAAFLAVIVFTWLMRIPPVEGRRRGSPLPDIVEGLAYVWRERIVLALIVLANVPLFLGTPYMALMPIIADDIFGMGASGLGVLMSASGIGAFSGSLLIASLGDFRHRGWLLLNSSLLFGVFLVVLAASRWFPLSLVASAGLGLAQVSLMPVVNALLLSHTPPHLQGRVMSVMMMDRGLGPMGAVVAGVLAEAFGAPFALGSMGTILIVFALASMLGLPQIRRLA